MQESLDGKELFTIEGSEKRRSTPDDLEEREKCRISRRKKHLHHHSRHTVRMSMNCASRTCTCSKKNATPGPSQFSDHSASVVDINGHVNDNVHASTSLQLWDLDCLLTDCTRGTCLTCTTETSNTLSVNCNWRISVVC